MDSKHHYWVLWRPAYLSQMPCSTLHAQFQKHDQVTYKLDMRLRPYMEDIVDRLQLPSGFCSMSALSDDLLSRQ